jgi:hypothetical protein
MPYSLDYNERIALASAMKLVLSQYDTTAPPEIVVEEIFAEGTRNCLVWQPFEDLSNIDVYNIIWQFQETIYEAMCASDFKRGMRSEFADLHREHKSMFEALGVEVK